MPAHSPVGAKIYVAMAGLLTYLSLLCLLRADGSNDVIQKAFSETYSSGYCSGLSPDSLSP